MTYSKVIGEAIRQERKKQKLSMAELGSKMGISGSLVGRYERGEENPKLGTIMRFADALNMEWAELAFLLAVAENGNASIETEKSNDKPSEQNENFQKMELLMLQLSPEGQQVALERVDELTQLQKYKRNTQDPSMSDEKASMLAKMVSDYADKDISEDDLAIIKHFQDHQEAPHPIKNSDT
jgi:transcriptional regulator with XRE-family HTH domain